MNILILDRAYRSRDLNPLSPLNRLTPRYKRPLEQLGHTVKSARSLADLVRKGDSLENYHLIIAHPYSTDAGPLVRAVSERENPHVVLENFA